MLRNREETENIKQKKTKRNKTKENQGAHAYKKKEN